MATNKLIIQNSSGNVGIGTTVPAGKFQISDSSSPQTRLHFSGSASSGNKGSLIFSHNRNSDGTQELLGYIQGVAEDNQSAGGSVYLIGDSRLNTLIDFQYQQHFKAENGQPGMGSQCRGKSGEDAIIRVPLGTVVHDADTEELIGEVLAEGQSLKVRQIEVPATQRGRSLFSDGFMKNSHEWYFTTVSIALNSLKVAGFHQKSVISW